MPEGILIGEGRGLPKRKDKTSKKAKVGKDKDPKKWKGRGIQGFVLRRCGQIFLRSGEAQLF